MFIAIRKYSGCKDPTEINRRIVASLVPNPPEVTIGETMSQIRA